MIKYDNWTISADGFEAGKPQFLESVFSQANGYMGGRAAFLIDGAAAHERCNYLAGGFDYIEPEVSDMVNIPDPFYFKIKLNGENPKAENGEYIKFNHGLDMRNGLYFRDCVWRGGDNHETRIEFSRFFSMSDKHASAYRIKLTALNYDGESEVTLGIDAGVENLPVYDDQTMLNENTMVMLRVLNAENLGDSMFLLSETRTGRLQIAQSVRICGADSVCASAEKLAAKRLSLSLKQGVSVETSCVINVFCSRDGDDFLARCRNSPAKSFDELLTESSSAWEKLWNDSDIIIEADIKTQAAIRYNIFQLLQNCPAGDPYVSIGARGLTHGRYKGCYFWDTDIFMLPFYQYIRPAAARDLVKFRILTLEDAKANARALNLDGARYPWMCAIGGAEQCHTWDIGRSEIHITADVAYAIAQYMHVTKDKSIEASAEKVYIETARYWASRFTYDENEDTYNLLFVKGPDEYCGVTNNNAFTVIMARHNLELGIRAAEKTSGADNAELKRWREIILKSKLIYDEKKQLFIQDENFLKTEPFDFSARDNGSPSYHKISYDRLQRYRVLKQADLVLLILMLPDYFTTEQKKAVWDFYEPLTLHDSTLSYGIHAYAAARLGLIDKAEDYFYKSLLLDLEDVMHNTGREGIHLAALGATWQSVVLGFAGLCTDNNGIPNLAPHIPAYWKSASFKFFVRGKQYKATITHEKHIVEEL